MVIGFFGPTLKCFSSLRYLSIILLLPSLSSCMQAPDDIKKPKIHIIPWKGKPGIIEGSSTPLKAALYMIAQLYPEEFENLSDKIEEKLRLAPEFLKYVNHNTTAKPYGHKSYKGIDKELAKFWESNTSSHFAFYIQSIIHKIRRQEVVTEGDISTLIGMLGGTDPTDINVAVEEILKRGFVNKDIVTLTNRSTERCRYTLDLPDIGTISERLNNYTATEIAVIPKRFIVNINKKLPDLDDPTKVTISRDKMLDGISADYRLISVTTSINKTYLLIVNNQDNPYDNAKWFRCCDGLECTEVSVSEVIDAATQPGSHLGYFYDIR